MTYLEMLDAELARLDYKTLTELLNNALRSLEDHIVPTISSPMNREIYTKSIEAIKSNTHFPNWYGKRECLRQISLLLMNTAFTEKENITYHRLEEVLELCEENAGATPRVEKLYRINPDYLKSKAEYAKPEQPEESVEPEPRQQLLTERIEKIGAKEIEHLKIMKGKLDEELGKEEATKQWRMRLAEFGVQTAKNLTISDYYDFIAQGGNSSEDLRELTQKILEKLPTEEGIKFVKKFKKEFDISQIDDTISESKLNSAIEYLENYLKELK